MGFMSYFSYEASFMRCFILVFLTGVAIFVIYMSSDVQLLLVPLKLIANESSKTIIVVPTGGMGNRMKSVAAFEVLKNCPNDILKLNPKLELYWPKLSPLNASFKDLFQLPDYPTIQFNDEVGLNFTLLTQRSSGMGADIYSKWLNLEVEGRFKQFSQIQSITVNTIAENFKKVQTIILVSAWGLPSLGSFESCATKVENSFFKSLEPSKAVNEIMQPIVESFKDVKLSGRIITGIHLRQGDLIRHKGYRAHTANRKESVEFLRHVLSPKSVLFVASDERDEAAKFENELRALGHEVLSLNMTEKFSESGGPNRGATVGMQIALADVFLLARCDVFWSNSKVSTYAKFASRVGGKNIRYIERK